MSGESCFRICCALAIVFFLTTFSLGGCSTFFPETREFKEPPSGHEKDSGQHLSASQEAVNNETGAKKEEEEPHVVVTPFGNDEIFAAGTRLGMSEQEVIQTLGEPIYKRAEYFEESGESYLTMEYPFGEFTFTDAYDDSYYWLCSIEIHSIGAAGPRGIQVGDPCDTVLTKFPNKNAVGEYSNETMEVLYGEHMHGANNGIAFYDNQGLSEIMFATDEFIGLRITVENGVVTHFILFVQVS